MNDASPQYLALGWQRGQQTGCVDAVKPKVTAKGYSVYQFNEEIAISARLRKVRARGQHPCQQHAFLTQDLALTK